MIYSNFLQDLPLYAYITNKLNCTIVVHYGSRYHERCNLWQKQKNAFKERWPVTVVCHRRTGFVRVPRA